MIRWPAIAALAGCAAGTQPIHHPIVNCFHDDRPAKAGRRFNVSRVAELVAGDSTLEDATCALGEPTSTSVNGLDGTILVAWNYANPTFIDGRLIQDSAVAMIQFATDRRMITVVSVTELR